ncbi:hypothetical protein ACFE04_021260 [Oxalis oulophora]
MKDLLDFDNNHCYACKMATISLPCTLPKRWAITYSALLQSEIILSFANGATGPVNLKTERSGQVVLYGESLEHLINRYNIRQDYRMDFQNIGRNQFLVKIRDKQGVEIEYENRMIDNSRWYQSKNKATTPSLCKMFGEEEANDGYLALPGIWGKHFEDFTMREVFLLVSDGSTWAIETRSFNDGTIQLFGVEFRKLVRQYGICNNWRAIFDYGEKSTFYLRLADEDGIEIECAGAHKGKRKKNISTPASSQDTNNTIVFLENGDMDSDFDDFDFVESGETEMVIYYTVTIIYIYDGDKVECNIRWGSVSSPDDAFISGGLPSFMNLLKSDVGDTIFFNLTEWDEVESFVTFLIDTMDE